MVRVLHEQTTYSTAFCLTLFVWRSLAVLELLLVMRIAVTFFITHPSFELEGVIDSMTSVFIAPFLFVGQGVSSEVEVALLATFCAMVVYPFLAMAAVYMLRAYDNYASASLEKQMHRHKQVSQA